MKKFEINTEIINNNSIAEQDVDSQNKKQSFKEGAMDNTIKLNEEASQKPATKKKIKNLNQYQRNKKDLIY